VKVAILCGGRGTRLREHGPAVPKPLVEIGGMPILWHVVQIYAAQGLRDFLLLTGHRCDEIEAFASSADWPGGVTVRCADTGEDTPTGGRLWRVRDELTEPFLATYADGVADIDLGALRAQHAASTALATVTVVRPRLPFGVAMLEGERLLAFRHGGFWACMDTYKDAIELNDLWRDGTAPWRKW
jgi:glucose-1-phosphate cytidylyltransferase